MGRVDLTDFPPNHYDGKTGKRIGEKQMNFAHPLSRMEHFPEGQFSTETRADLAR